MTRRAIADHLRRGFELTPAEADIAAALAEGIKAPDIAQARGITMNTLKTVRQRVYSKLAVKDQVELMRELPRLLSDGPRY